MNDQNRIFAGILSFIPLVTFGASIILSLTIFFNFFENIVNGKQPEEVVVLNTVKNMAGWIIAIVVMSLVSLAVLVYFIVQVFNNPAIKTEERLIWLLVFLFAGMICFPIYWYLKIWKSTDHPPVSYS